MLACVFSYLDRKRDSIKFMFGFDFATLYRYAILSHLFLHKSFSLILRNAKEGFKRFAIIFVSTNLTVKSAIHPFGMQEQVAKYFSKTIKT